MKLFTEVAVLLHVLLVVWAMPEHGNYDGLKLTMNSTQQSNVTCSGLAMIGDSFIRVILYNVDIPENKEYSFEIIILLLESECESVNKEDCTSNSQLVPVAKSTYIFGSDEEPPQNFHFQLSFTHAVKPDYNINTDLLDNTEGAQKPIEETTDNKPTVNTTDNKPTVETTDNKPTVETTDNKPTVETTDNKPTVKTTDNKPTVETTDNKPTVETTDNKPTVKTIDNKQTREATSKKSNGTTNGSKLNDATTEETTTKDDWRTFTINSSGIYVVKIYAKNLDVTEKKNGFLYKLSFNVEMKNHFGFLSLVDYPAMIVYSILLVVYIFYAFLWIILMACNYKDLVRLQFWILGVIILGFLEKVFFVAEFGSANEGHDSSGLIYIAEGVSAAKRALARMLLIIVCEGFGTVKPRLGPILTKVLAAGGIYFVVAFIDGAIRASKVTTESHDLTTMLTFGLLFLVDTAILYWIFSALVTTRRALRIRKNIVKLSLYNHLAYALIATVIASLVFIVWQFVAITRSGCTSDWREMWLIDCYWHMLFCFILLVIMIIWRPSANKLRFAYAQVNNEDSEEEQVQGPNKNFDSLKMRNITKPEGPKPILLSQEAEEDMKWAEENLPTTMIDKTLPVLLDSEEEVMTTKFETSKMN